MSSNDDRLYPTAKALAAASNAGSSPSGISDVDLLSAVASSDACIATITDYLNDTMRRHLKPLDPNGVRDHFEALADWLSCQPAPNR